MTQTSINEQVLPSLLQPCYIFIDLPHTTDPDSFTTSNDYRLAPNILGWIPFQTYLTHFCRPASQMTPLQHRLLLVNASIILLVG